MRARRKKTTERKFKIYQRDDDTVKASAAPGGLPALAFVNVENPEQIKNRATQRHIRRHVMTPIGHSRRRDANNPIESHPDTALAIAAVNSIPRSVPELAPSHWGEVRLCANFRRFFLAMDMVSNKLISMSLDETSPSSAQKVSSEAHDERHADGEDRTESRQELVLYTDSLGSVRKSIHAADNPTNRRTIIGTIICLAYFDLRHGNFKEWAMHMQGIEYVVNLHGGVQALELNQPLRQCLFLTDVLGALVFDTCPRFPLPNLPRNTSPWMQRPASTLSKSVDVVAPQTELSDRSSIIIRNAMEYISKLAFLLNHLPQDSHLQMGLDLLVLVVRIAHDLLSLPGSKRYGFETGHGFAILPQAPISAAAQLVRTSALTLVSTVITTVSATNIYCATHRRGFVQSLVLYAKFEGWGEWEYLRLWVLVIQITIESGPAKEMYLDEIMDAMRSLSLGSWDRLMSYLYSIAWINHGGIPEMAKLKSNIEDRLAQESV